MVAILEPVSTSTKNAGLSYRLIPTGGRGETICINQEHPEAKVGVGSVEVTESGIFRFVNPRMQWHKVKLNGVYAGSATLKNNDFFEPGDGIKYQVRICEMGA